MDFGELKRGSLGHKKGSSRITGKHRTLIEYISVAAVTADLGSAFTAGKNGAPPGAK
jgi:hypothetical protein